VKPNERLQAQRWLYGREITADDIMWADRERGVLIIRDPVVADRLVAAVMIEADERGVVLVNVADLPPVTHGDVEAMKEHVAAHLQPYVADGEIKREHPRRYKPIILAEREAEYIHIAYMLLQTLMETTLNPRTVTSAQRTRMELRAILTRGNFDFTNETDAGTAQERVDR
jgi:hypothetical protein